AQPGVEAGPARAGQSRAVGLVVRRLVDDDDAEFRRQLGERLAHADIEVVGLDDAGPRDEKRGGPPAELRRHVSRPARRAWGTRWRRHRSAAAVSGTPTRRPRTPRTGDAGASAAT